MTNNRAAIYLRVSTAAQVETAADEDGLSIAAQREACLAKAAALDATVVEEYVDRGESARSADRRSLQLLLERLRRDRDLDYIICHKLDRMARSRRDDIEIELVIRRAGARLVSVTENIDDTPSGILLHGVIASVAEFYSANLAAEVRKGMDQKAKRGIKPGRAPIGYRNTTREIDGRELRTIETDMERAALVTWCFDEFATGEWTLRSLRNAANAKGLTYPETRKQPERPISTNGLNGMLRNRFYTGTLIYKGVEYPGEHEPLIDLPTFERVQQVLDNNNRVGTNKTWKHAHHLKGLLRCKRCGAKLCFTAANGNGGTYEYFYCGGRQRRNGCDLPHLHNDAVEAQIVQQHYDNRLPEERATELEALFKEQSELLGQAANHEADRQRRQLDKIERQRDKLLQAHYADAITINHLKKEQRRLTTQEIQAQTLLERAQAAAHDPTTIITRALAFVTSPASTYRDAPNQARRELNLSWFECFRIDTHKCEAILNPALALLLDPQLPTELQRQNAHYNHRGHDLADWDEIVAQLRITDTAKVNGSKVPLMVGRTGLEPVTSAV